MKKVKINEDTLTSIVMFSIRFCVFITITGIILACFGVDISTITTSTHTVFGVELGACMIIKIVDRNNETQDRRAERMRQRRERSGLNERNTENYSTKSADG